MFTQFREMGDLLQRHLSPSGSRSTRRSCTAASHAPGATGWSPSSRPATAPPLLLVSLKAGGTGLNLTAASQVIHYDRWWNPAVEDQATDRAWRIGQQRTVNVHKLVCQGTVEERIGAGDRREARDRRRGDRHRRGVADRSCRPTTCAKSGGARMSRPRKPYGPHPPGRLYGTMIKVLAAEISDQGRLSRGKRYWADDAVVDIVVGHGAVTAEIQGVPPAALRRDAGGVSRAPGCRPSEICGCSAPAPTTPARGSTPASTRSRRCSP